MSLVNYSSSEDDLSDSEDKEPPPRKIINKSPDKSSRLPLPTAIQLLGKMAEINDHNDDPSSHDGRIRGFAHERGNWATCSFIEMPLNEAIMNLQTQLKCFCKATLGKDFNEVKNPHASLTRTVVLRHHWINSFISSIKNRIKNIRRFQILLDSLNIYCNDEKTRTFIGVTISEDYTSSPMELVKIFDSCLSEFNLPTYYKDPSFHVSILWCVGDFRDKLLESLDNFKNIFNNCYKENVCDFSVNVSIIYCKTGNKLYQFPLGN